MAPITCSAPAARKVLKFPFLPTELRLMIWRESFEPRILHITSETTVLPETSRAYRRPVSTHVRFKSREKAPIALQICHESRAFALKYYVESFHSRTGPLERASQVKQTALYFNPELDIVHIVHRKHGNQFWNLSNLVHKETIQSIKVLALANEHFDHEWMKYIAERLFAFSRLETLILVVDVETGRREYASSIQDDMENHLVKAKDRVVLSQNCMWGLPAVKATARQLVVKRVEKWGVGMMENAFSWCCDICMGWDMQSIFLRVRLVETDGQAFSISVSTSSRMERH